MIILMLEDRGSSALDLIPRLEAKGHQVLAAGNVVAASGLWEDRRPDCLIVDLNMPAHGLKPVEINQTRNGLFTGWVWVREYVFKEHPEMRTRTIIYSVWLGELKKHLEDRPHELDGIRLVPRGRGTPNDVLMQCVDEIAGEVTEK